MRTLLTALAVVGALAIVLALLFATGVARLAWDGAGQAPLGGPQREPTAAADPGTAPAASPTEAPSNARSEPAASPAAPAAPPVAPAPQAVALADGVVGGPAPAPGAQAAEANRDGAVQINEPGGEHVLGLLDGGARLTLRGRVGTLKVMGVNGRSTLNASGLKADRVVFAGEVNGGSTVRVSAPGGSIRFEAAVNGLSHVQADAPGGTVSFAAGGKGGKGAGEVNGESDLSITAKRVEFDAPVNGTGTRIAVTTTRDGSIRFRDLLGAARIVYRKADPSDPEPLVEAGAVAAAARVEKGQ